MGGNKKSSTKHKRTKGKRWKKGHSSESNPQSKKFRFAAKNRFFSVKAEGTSDLTIDALAKHNAGQEHGEQNVLTEGAPDTQSIGGGAKTFNTWATNWTECTNATFGKVHRYWSSNSAYHKEILAVLAAVTEVIKEKGGTESETDYFAALMTTLETVDDAESLSAVTYLLSLVIKRVPAAVLKSRFSEVSKCFLKMLATYNNVEGTACVKSLLICLAQVLRVQDQAAWSASSTMQVYNTLLAFIIHAKPKIRKAAQHAVRVVLKASSFMVCDNAPPCHPAASTTAKYCIQQIEESGGSAEAHGTLHTLGLLQYILGYFPQNSLKSTCETILRVMTLANVLVTSVAMKALHGMFLSKPRANCLSAELNAQIITALYDYQPGENDTQQMGAWLAVMERAHSNLHRLNEQLGISHLPRLFASCMKCMQSEKQDICQTGAKILKTLLKECVAPSAELLETAYKQAPGNSALPVHKMFKYVEAGLNYQYHASWNLVLQVLGVFFEVLGKQCSPLMKKCLLSMADLRDSHKFPFTADLDSAIGMAVKTMGPRKLLEAIPLQITGEEDNYNFPRSWLLPVLRDNVQETELAYFTTYFLPLAAKLRIKSIEYAKQEAIVQSKSYDALQMQIWSLLPGFCIRPTDLQESFQGIAKILGSALTDRPDLQLDIMASLRKLISQNKDSEENKAVLARFAKNYIPILFNLFTSDPGKNEKDSKRLAVLETVKCYLQITDKQVITSFFDRCFEKMQDSDISAFRRHALMDLNGALVLYVDEERVKKMYHLVIGQLKSTDRTIQKKSYRILEEICSGKSEDCKQFVKSCITDLQNELLKSLSSSSPSSKAPRLRCLIHIFRQLEEPNPEFLTAVVPEGILCTKEVAERARVAAYNLLVEMGKTAVRWSLSEDTEETRKDDALKDFFELILAGLAGSPHMVACTVLALTRILYEFKESVKTDLLEVLVDATCLLLKSKSREIVTSSMELVKVLLAVFPDTTLAQHLQNLVSSLVSMKDDNKHHLRFKAKELFTRFIRKFGFEVIYGMVPESHQKLLNNIRKTTERTKRRKKEAKENEGSDDESDDEHTFTTKQKVETVEDLLKESDSELEEDESSRSKTKKSKKQIGSKGKHKGSAWIKEEAEEIIDFMDPSVAKKVLATKPDVESSDKKGIKHDFKMAPDGRLIINDESDEETQKKHKKKGKTEAMETDDLDDLLEALDGAGKSKSRKRKLAVEDLPDKDSASLASSYRPGGHGIHRPLGTKKAKTENGNVKTGKEYKAKKAGGDVKKKGKPDPYAYLPLEKTFLNKRKKKKASGQFKNLVKGAKKGAAKGSKLRHKAK